MKSNELARKLDTVSLLDAVLCVDCETVSNSPHDQCLVCGSTSLLNLHRLLEGTIPHSPGRLDAARYNLEITARVKGFSAQDLSETAESITRLLGSKPTGRCEKLHINVEPVLDDANRDAAIAA